MKKILFLTSVFPRPLDNGSKIRDYHIMERLCRNHELSLVCFKENSLKDSEASLPFLPPEKCHLAEMGNMRIRTFLRNHDLPLWCLAYYSEELKKILDALIKSEHFDYMHISRSYMAQYALRYKNIVRVVDHHNVKTSLYLNAQRQTNNLRKKINYSAEYYKWYKYEREVLRNFEFHLACSPLEKKAIENFADGQVRMLPSGVDTDRFYEKISAGTTTANLLFTGSLDYFANHEAAVYFCEKILPFIRKVFPDVVFQVVGRRPRKSLERLIKKTPNVWLACNVRDIRPFYYQSGLFVVPLLNGGGTRLKIMEAMATGLPVVTTSKGCEGLGLADGEGVVIADGPARFAEAVISLLNDKQRYGNLRRNAATISRERFSWNKALAPLDTIYT